MKSETKLKDLRGAVAYLKKTEALFTVAQEVDPIYEIAGIVKEFDGGPALLFEKIKGYPQVRNVANLFSRKEAIADLFDLDGPAGIMQACHQALKNPLAPEPVAQAACQRGHMSSMR